MRQYLLITRMPRQANHPRSHAGYSLTTIQNTANYIGEKVQGTGAEASKEANKEVAKDSNATVGTRVTAAKDAVIDKKDEVSHDIKADTHKEAAKH
ncbi:glucose-repressible protein [Phlyctema vagabunda]|uniref:Glucose-repressible protein n=1 Tax=Phlyctema vagabunda TaxID=108571 RepID=A0ABR4PLX1_9HELO